MPLRNILEVRDETLQELYLASEARYVEGKQLVKDGQYDGGIYLLGLSAEMLLKLAFYRLDPAVKLTDLADSFWSLLGNKLRPLFLNHKVDRHDLLALSIVLTFEHEAQLGAYAIELDRAFSRCINRLYENWWITMRYRGRSAVLYEAEQVVEDVEWLRNNHNRLRS